MLSQEHARKAFGLLSACRKCCTYPAENDLPGNVYSTLRNVGRSIYRVYDIVINVLRSVDSAGLHRGITNADKGGHAQMKVWHIPKREFVLSVQGYV